MSRLIAVLILFDGVMLMGTMQAHLLDVKAAEAAPETYAQCVYKIYGVSPTEFEAVYGRRATCE